MGKNRREKGDKYLSQFVIKKLVPPNTPPAELLLLADPSWSVVATYLEESLHWLALAATEVVGSCSLLLKEKQVGEIVNLAVYEHQQRQGVGRLLLCHVIAYAKTELHLSSLEIGTGNSSLHQLQLYQQLGFRIRRVEPDYFLQNYIEPLWEDGLRCRDRILLVREL